MNVTVETEYSRFGHDRAKAMEWLMDALIADGLVDYTRAGDLHTVLIVTPARGSKPGRVETPKSGSIGDESRAEGLAQTPPAIRGEVERLRELLCQARDEMRAYHKLAGQQSAFSLQPLIKEIEAALSSPPAEGGEEVLYLGNVPLPSKDSTQ